MVRWEDDAIDAARAELDARFEPGEAARVRGLRALRSVHDPIARRDRGASTGAPAPGHHVDDHRRLGWGTTLDNGALLVESQRLLAEIAPDLQYRFDHVRVSDCGYLAHLTQVGTREGGAFESPFVYVAALDASGRPDRFDLWDVEQAEQALARFDEFRASTSPAVILAPNAAELISAFVLFDADDGRSARREAWARWAVIELEVAATVWLGADLCDGFDARDGARVRSLCADDLLYDDRRRTGVGRMAGLEIFEIDDFTAARGRFEELCAARI